MQPSDISPEFVRILAVLGKLVVLSLLLERALVIVFEYRWYKDKLAGAGLKVPITLLVSWLVCGYYQFDALCILLEPGEPTSLGICLTAAIAAGGSAGAITLIQVVFKFSKDAQDIMTQAHKAEAEARLAEAEAKKKRAKAEADASLMEFKARRTEAEARITKVARAA